MYSPEAGDGNYQSGFRSVEAADEKLCGGRSRGSSPCDSLTRGGDSNICWTRIGDSALESSYYLVEENTTSLRPKKRRKKKERKKKGTRRKRKDLTLYSIYINYHAEFLGIHTPSARENHRVKSALSGIDGFQGTEIHSSCVTLDKTLLCLNFLTCRMEKIPKS